MTTAQERPAFLHASTACPPCFDVWQWVLWRAPHKGVKVPRPKTYCEDCTPEYQAEMLTRQRCQHPETFFVRDADGFISGHRPPTQEAT